MLEKLLGEDSDGWTVPALRNATGCGQATAYEVLRVLRAIEMVGPASTRDGYKVAVDHSLRGPLSDLIDALQTYVDTPVDRPPRGRRRA